MKSGRNYKDLLPAPDPLVWGKDPWIRIRTKMSRIHNTDLKAPSASGYLGELKQLWTHIQTFVLLLVGPVKIE